MKKFFNQQQILSRDTLRHINGGGNFHRAARCPVRFCIVGVGNPPCVNTSCRCVPTSEDGLSGECR